MLLIDRSTKGAGGPIVSFDQVRRLEHYIEALKEMGVLPLVYPELFERFRLSPPRACCSMKGFPSCK